MQVKCRHCGGENGVHPGQRMLFCAFCGSALVIERTDSPEHLILPHKRNDRGAEEALRSYLLSKKRGRPSVEKTDFAFTPFLLVEDDEGDTDMVPASAATDLFVSYPPAGNYYFFDEELAEGETIIPLDGSDDARGGSEPGDGALSQEQTEGEEAGKKVDRGRVVKILHLPVYTLEYSCGGFEGTAAVVGGSWQVRLAGLPAESPAELRFSNLIFLAALFTLFLFIGKAAPGWLLRFVYVLLAAGAGYLFFYLRERMGTQS